VREPCVKVYILSATVKLTFVLVTMIVARYAPDPLHAISVLCEYVCPLIFCFFVFLFFLFWEIKEMENWRHTHCHCALQVRNISNIL
jgi:hypothetical protein